MFEAVTVTTRLVSRPLVSLDDRWGIHWLQLVHSTSSADRMRLGQACFGVTG